jgi:hypothetical protein
MQENSSDIQENFCQILNSQQDSLEIKLNVKETENIKLESENQNLESYQTELLKNLKDYENMKVYFDLMEKKIERFEIKEKEQVQKSILERAQEFLFEANENQKFVEEKEENEFLPASPDMKHFTSEKKNLAQTRDKLLEEFRMTINDEIEFDAKLSKFLESESPKNFSGKKKSRGGKKNKKHASEDIDSLTQKTKNIKSILINEQKPEISIPNKILDPEKEAINVAQHLGKVLKNFVVTDNLLEGSIHQKLNEIDLQKDQENEMKEKLDIKNEENNDDLQPKPNYVDSNQNLNKQDEINELSTVLKQNNISEAKKAQSKIQDDYRC